VAAADTEKKPAEPFAFADFSWVPGNYGAAERPFSSKECLRLSPRGPHPACVQARRGEGLISGRKAFQRPMAEGVKLLNSIQDVYLCKDVTVA
jgi:hypothetical protein